MPSTVSKSSEAPFSAQPPSCCVFWVQDQVTRPSSSTSKVSSTECSNKDQVNVIAPPNDGAVTYPGSTSFFAAPWLVDVIMAAGTSDHFKLIPAVNTAAAAFDTKHKNNAEYITKAQDHAGDFILWAWGAGAGQVLATKMTFNPNDGNLEHFKNKQHQHCITQAWMNPPGGLPPPPPQPSIKWEYSIFSTPP
jgi:hypothetical protein